MFSWCRELMKGPRCPSPAARPLLTQGCSQWPPRNAFFPLPIFTCLQPQAVSASSGTKLHSGRFSCSWGVTVRHTFPYGVCSWFDYKSPTMWLHVSFKTIAVLPGKVRANCVSLRSLMWAHFKDTEGKRALANVPCCFCAVAGGDPKSVEGKRVLCLIHLPQSSA